MVHKMSYDMKGLLDNKVLLLFSSVSMDINIVKDVFAVLYYYLKPTVKVYRM